MDKFVLWRKAARIIMLLSEELRIKPEDALTIFYESHTGELLLDQRGGLHLMSDMYVVEDIITEIESHKLDYLDEVKAMAEGKSSEQ